jgi:hypothetical protein
VRLHYFESQKAVAEIKAQRRSTYNALPEFYKGEAGANPEYDPKRSYDNPNITDASFKIPFPVSDVSMNPHLLEPPQNVDISQYHYE